MENGLNKFLGMDNFKITGVCHCGQVGFEINETPKYLVDCNCSICRRLAPLWGHVHLDSFKKLGEGQTIKYAHGDRTLAIHTCAQCGCTTHWESLIPENTKVAVNFRMCEPELLDHFRIRKFDGADSWKFLD